MPVWNPQWSISGVSAGSLMGRRFTEQQNQTIWDTDAHAQQVARESAYVSGPIGMPRLAAMIGVNSNLIFGPYLKSIQNPVGNGTNGDDGTWYPNAWYVHLRDGSKAQQAGTYVNWLMETGFYTETHAAVTRRGPLSGTTITASSWAEFHIKDAVAVVASTNAQSGQAGTHPFRSLWFDSADTFSADATPGFWSTGPGSNPGLNPHTGIAYTKQEFRDMVGYLGDVARNLVSGLTTINPERLWIAANGLRISSFARHWDMAMVEGWLYNNGARKYGNQASVESLLQTVIDAQVVYGTVVETFDWGGSGQSAAVQTQQRREAAAANIITARGLSTFLYQTTKSERPDLQTPLDPDLYGNTHIGGAKPPMDLGTPLATPTTVAAVWPAGHRAGVGTGNGQASAAGLLVCLLDSGTVLWNPTGATINYKASKSYTRVPDLQDTSTPSYVAGNLIPVAPNSATFLTTSGGSGGTAPTLGAPDVTGTAQVGQTLTAVPGALTGSPAPAVTYQWQQSANGTTGWTNVPGATGPTYTIGAGLVTDYLRVSETATNSAGTATTPSAATAQVVAASSTPTFTTQPSVSGQTTEASTLTADPGAATGSPTFTYQWETSATGAPGSWSSIGGATAATYTLPGGSAGSYKRCKVTATNGSGATNAWAPKGGPITVADVIPSFGTPASISGTPQSGDVLTADPGVATGSPNPAITQQWRRSADGGATWVDILGETSLTYLVPATDVADLITIAVTATNRAGSATSTPTAVGPVTLPTQFPNLEIIVTSE